MRFSLIGFAASTLVWGCTSEGSRPAEAPSNTEDTSYATAYPDELARVAGDYDSGRSKVADKVGEIKDYPAAIKDPVDSDRWLEVVEAAERSGKSRSYAERARENRAFARMIDENDGDIVKHTAGATQFVAEQKACQSPPDVANAAATGLRKGIEKRFQDRRENANEATYLIKSHADALGKNNTAALSKQADVIAHLSFLAEVEIPALAAERDRLLDEQSGVASTIDRRIDEEKQRQARAGASDSEKKASAERQRELEGAKQALAARQKLGDRRAAREQELAETQKLCRQALDDLKDAIRKRANAAPKPH